MSWNISFGVGFGVGAAMPRPMYGGGYGMPMQPGGFQPFNRNAQLAGGVKNGSINKDEFRYLNNYQNQSERLKQQYLSDGYLSPQERMSLGMRQMGYDQTYQNMAHGDYHPRTVATDGMNARQIRQGDRIFNGLKNGSATFGEGVGLLNQQRGIAGTRGAMERDGWLNPFERMQLNGMQNRASGDIFSAKHNWNRDGGAFFPPFFPFF